MFYTVQQSLELPNSKVLYTLYNSVPDTDATTPHVANLAIQTQPCYSPKRLHSSYQKVIQCNRSEPVIILDDKVVIMSMYDPDPVECR
jgi:hypothetical protein